jgi:alpha-1,2-mannosyltransferase
VAGFIATLCSGDWLTRERLRLLPVAVLIMSVFAIVYVVTTSDGLNDYQGRPLGSDFSNVYAAGTYVREGHPSAPFDWPAQYKREKEIFGLQTQFYGWHYPPFFLFVAAALATMPYPLALLVWQIATLALYLVVMRAIVVSLPSPPCGEGKGK